MAVAAVTLASAVLLAGCAPTAPQPTKPPNASTPTTAAEPVATETPAPSGAPESWARTAITQIVVRPELLQMKDKAGVELGAISYDATADMFVDLFSDLLGAEPTVTDTPGGIESLPVTHYKWDGFEVQDDHEQGDYQADMNLSVTFTDAELGPRHIAVSTVQGFKPGDDLSWLAKYMDEPFDERSEFNQVQAEHGPPVGEQSPHNEYSNANSVTGQNLYGHDGSVIFAPWNFGIGHV
jgi:hypothetical protein